MQNSSLPFKKPLVPSRGSISQKVFNSSHSSLLSNFSSDKILISVEPKISFRILLEARSADVSGLLSSFSQVLKFFSLLK